MIFLSLLVIPVIFSLILYWVDKTPISLSDLGKLTLVQTVIAGVFSLGIFFQSMGDTEIWNGVVASKHRERVSCSHSYSCNCVQISCGKGCTTTSCSICYEHSYDIDWYIKTSNRERVDVNTRDRQGHYVDPRWEKMNIGDPTAVKHTFINYLKASPDSVFRSQGLAKRYEKYLQPYPLKIYDYYKLDRVLVLNGELPGKWVWDFALSELNSKLGPTKQANVIIVFVYNLPREIASAFREHWINGKKNDIVIFFGLDGGAKPTWVDGFSWAEDASFDVQLRDRLLDLTRFHPTTVMQTIEEVAIAHFQRKSMEDYAYLKSRITPPLWLWALSMLVGLLVTFFGYKLLDRR